MCHGCGTLGSSGTSKTLNTSNLQKTNSGVYRIANSASYKPSPGKALQHSESVTGRDNVSNGLPVKDSEVVREINNPTVLSPKVRSQLNDSYTPSNKNDNLESKQGIIPINIQTERVDKPLVKVNWSGLLAFYILAIWTLVMAWLTWRFIRNYNNRLTNPFTVEEKKKEKKSKRKK